MGRKRSQKRVGKLKVRRRVGRRRNRGGPTDRGRRARTRAARKAHRHPVGDRPRPTAREDRELVPSGFGAPGRPDDSGVAHFEELFRSVGRELLHAVDGTLGEESVDPAHATAFQILVADHLLAAEIGAGTDADPHDDEGPLPLHLLTAVGLLVTWLTLVRDEEADPHMLARAVAWVRGHLGAEPAREAAVIGAFLGEDREAGVTARQLYDGRAPRLVPALVWLAAAVVDRCGEGDVSWLPHGHYAP